MGKFSRTLQKKIIQAGWRIHVDDYIKYSMLATAIAAAVAWVLGGAKASGITLMLGIVALVALPFRFARARAELAEAELPYFLRTLASEVDAGIPYMQALEDACNSAQTLGRSVRRAIALYKRGIPISKALSAVADEFDSENIRRALTHVAALYHLGKEAQTLKHMADAMLSIHRAESKRFSAKLALYSLFFLGVAALLPAMFIMYTAIGSLFLTERISPSVAFAIADVIMPMISIASLAFMYIQMPAFLRR